MEESKQIYTISIKRSKKYLNFKVELAPTLTVIDALDHIRFTIDPSIKYRHSCHHGSCGTCACIINNVERLACMTFLYEFNDNIITIEPLKSFKVISDLVIDISQMIKKMPQSSYLRESDFSKDSIKPNGILEWNRFENCIECGSCVSACPVEKDFLGPSVLASVHREIEKQKNPKIIENLKTVAFSKEGIVACEKHFACSKVCPTKVSPGKHINDLRKLK